MFLKIGGRSDSFLCNGSFWLVEVFHEGKDAPDL